MCPEILISLLMSHTEESLKKDYVTCSFSTIAEFKKTTFSDFFLLIQHLSQDNKALLTTGHTLLNPHLYVHKHPFIWADLLSHFKFSFFWQADASSSSIIAFTENHFLVPSFNHSVYIPKASNLPYPYLKRQSSRIITAQKDFFTTETLFEACHCLAILPTYKKKGW